MSADDGDGEEDGDEDEAPVAEAAQAPQAAQFKDVRGDVSRPSGPEMNATLTAHQAQSGVKKDMDGRKLGCGSCAQAAP